jgi:hypothetical protein
VQMLVMPFWVLSAPIVQTMIHPIHGRAGDPISRSKLTSDPHFCP